MKKDFTTAAEELITGMAVPPKNDIAEKHIASETPPENKYFRYVEPRTERMNLLLSKSLVKKLSAEAKKRKMSKNGLVNAILESYYNDEKKETNV